MSRCYFGRQMPSVRRQSGDDAQFGVRDSYSLTADGTEQTSGSIRSQLRTPSQQSAKVQRENIINLDQTWVSTTDAHSS